MILVLINIISPSGQYRRASKNYLNLIMNSDMNKVQHHRLHILVIAAIWFGLSVLFAGCDADDNIGDDPYGGGKEPLGIRLLTDLPIPDRAYPGELVTFKAEGLERWIDNEVGRYDFSFYISNEQAEIISATDTT